MATAAETIALLNLLALEGVGSGTAIRLVNICGSAEAVFLSTDNTLRAIHGITDRTLTPLRKSGPEADTGRKQYESAQKANVEVRTFWDESYPPVLKDLETDAPAVLFIRGKLKKDAPRVAMVGTRRASAYGESAVNMIVGGLRGSGLHVVSGLASGIDGFAHRSALNADLVTEAVFGCGVDRIYPPTHAELARQILEHDGALLSEYPLGTKQTKYTFPQRNRIIAGLCKATIVVEAPMKSGAQITARLSIEYGRDVGAVPGSVTSAVSRGTHELIKSGAALIESPEDVLGLVKGIAPEPAQPVVVELPSDLPEEERKVLELLQGAEAMHIDVLSEKTALATSELLSRLLMLELKSLIKQLPGKYFVRA